MNARESRLATSHSDSRIQPWHTVPSARCNYDRESHRMLPQLKVLECHNCRRNRHKVHCMRLEQRKATRQCVEAAKNWMMKVNSQVVNVARTALMNVWILGTIIKNLRLFFGRNLDCLCTWDRWTLKWCRICMLTCSYALECRRVQSSWAHLVWSEQCDFWLFWRCHQRLEILINHENLKINSLRWEHVDRLQLLRIRDISSDKHRNPQCRRQYERLQLGRISDDQQ